MVRRPNLTLLGSAVLYVLARLFDWNLPSYPPGTTWYFNPFAWQLMFFFAAWCAVGGAEKYWHLIQSRVVFAISLAWIAFGFLIVMTWHSDFLASLIPKWMMKAIYPIDKTDLDMLRFTHFLAVAVVVSRYVPPKWGPLTAKWTYPLRLCGRHSLPIFCIGVFLSFGAHWILVQYDPGIPAQIGVSLAGFLIMVAIGWALDQSQKVPDLFVEVSDLEAQKAATGSGPA
jgi:hypothetical protein